ncbi:MAG: hypothetical protein KZQ99_09750 [Candidatus Thiodiazotropha sp. (ex Dulcina madagascariensis)]|nr:hypothetical protein [Candidatus Thiodiazotropha sp. (ex Dulcina madagascariensis)]
MQDYFIKNPLKSTFVTISSFGFILLFAYYWHIQYIPEMSLEALSSILVSVALTGTLFVLVLSSVLFYSGIVWPTNVEVLPISTYWSGIDIETGKGILLWYGVPVFLILASLFSFASVFWWLTFIPIILLFIYFRFFLYKRALKASDDRKHLFQYISHTCYAALLYIPAAAVLYSLFKAAERTDGWLDLFLFIASLLIIWIFNQLLIIKPKNIDVMKWYLSVISVAIILLLSLTSSGHVIPSVLARINGVGNIPDVYIVAKGDICSALPEYVYLNEKVAEFTEEVKIADKSPLCKFKQLRVLSKLGKELYLEYPSRKAKETEIFHRFTISKRNVTTQRTIKKIINKT